jgi:methylmalonyl-CoA mutase
VADPAGGSWYVESRTRDLAAAAWAVFQAAEAAGGYAAARQTGLVAAGCHETRTRREADIAHRRTPIVGVSDYVAPGEPETRVPAPPSRHPLHRHAAAFERLRDRADAAAVRPTVFVARLGQASVPGLFAAGGVVTTAVPAGDDPAATTAAFLASGARVACVAGGDDALAERVTRTLTEAGAVRVWSGLDHHSDAVTVLTTTLSDLGVPE